MRRLSRQPCSRAGTGGFGVLSPARNTPVCLRGEVLPNPPRSGAVRSASGAKDAACVTLMSSRRFLRGLASGPVRRGTSPCASRVCHGAIRRCGIPRLASHRVTRGGSQSRTAAPHSASRSPPPPFANAPFLRRKRLTVVTGNASRPPFANPPPPENETSGLSHFQNCRASKRHDSKCRGRQSARPLSNCRAPCPSSPLAKLPRSTDYSPPLSTHMLN